MKEEAEQWLKELVDLLKQRKAEYSGALLSYSLVCDKGKCGVSKLEVTFGDGDFLQSQTESVREYGKCSLFREKVSLEVAEEHIRNLYGKGQVSLAKKDIEIEPQDLRHDTLNSSRSPVNLGWPCEFYYSNASQPDKPYWDGPLISIDEPLYPDLGCAESDWLVSGRGEEYVLRLQTNIGVIFPSFKARLRNLVVGSGQIEVDVEARLAKKRELVGKYYVEIEKKVFQGDFTAESANISIPERAYPDRLSVYLVDRKTSQGIDWKSYSSGSMGLEKGVKIDTPAGDIEGLLRGGENQFVEFKLIFPSKKPKEFHESVSAFANTKGGVILVGVDNNGDVVGVGEEDLETRILDSINNSLVPIPSVSFDRKKVGDKEIVVLRVEAGDDPPYLLDGKYCYLRSGGTDYHAARVDLDSIYRKKYTETYTETSVWGAKGW